jgi:hypothetical protein
VNSEPATVIDGIEFRSITVLAYKGNQGPCLERNQAAVYRGPFKKVEDDDGHTYLRGARMAVCDKTFQLLQKPPYEGQFDLVEPRSSIATTDAKPYDCRRAKTRDARESKGANYRATTESVGPCYGSNGACC